ncbi:MAG: reverse transcriptase-like protein [Archaeoglobus sp.]|nr:reverse transcriptase-like protein [Archaeoglobus sp.]
MTKLYFSATFVSGKAAYAYVLPRIADRGIINGTRIVAEYLALVRGLKKAIDNDRTKLTVLGPKLVINQLNGVTPVKSRKVLPLYQEARELLSSFRKIELAAVQWKRNKAFSISTRALIDFFEKGAIARSKKISDRHIHRTGGLKFDVKGYTVDLGKETCNCPFFIKTNDTDIRKSGIQIRCEHIFAAERYISR